VITGLIIWKLLHWIEKIPKRIERDDDRVYIWVVAKSEILESSSEISMHFWPRIEIKLINEKNLKLKLQINSQIK